MLKLDLQFFGGRGQGYKRPTRPNRPRKPSTTLGPNVPATLSKAIGTKGSNFTIAEAFGDANPNYDPTGRYSDYRENCQRCVVAYEMRRRGYDVTALPTYAGDTAPRVRRTDKNGDWDGWLKAFRKAKPTNVGASRAKGVEDNIEKNMAKWGAGSRAVVSLYWKGGGGHVFNVENVNGSTVAVDAQTGKKVSLANYLGQARPGSVTLIRTDNLRPDNTMREFVTSENSYKRKRK